MPIEVDLEICPKNSFSYQKICLGFYRRVLSTEHNKTASNNTLVSKKNSILTIFFFVNRFWHKQTAYHMLTAGILYLGSDYQLL